ncbi:Bro-N domain-containing protein, partial [Gardnerella pickettii]
MNELQVFNNVELGSVRTTVVDGIPYFVGKDVAEILGYRDTSDALKRHVDE